MLSRIQKTVIYYKLKSSTHTEEVTIENHRRWNQLGRLISNRTIKKTKRVWVNQKLALAK